MTDEVRKIVKLCYSHCDEAVGIIEFLEAGNTPEVEARFCADPSVAHLVRKAMMQRLVMSIMRMHDGDTKDRKKETLLKVFNLLNDQAVRNGLSTSTYGGDRLRLSAAITEWPTLNDDPVKGKMRAVRNYELAHNIPLKAGVRPTMSEFIGFSRDTIKIVEHLAAGTGVAFVSIGGVQKIWAERAASYWECLQRKEPTI